MSSLSRRLGRLGRLRRLRLRLPALAGGILVAWLAAPAGMGETAAGGDREVFRFAELNRRYEDLATEMVPVEEGGMQVTLSSPSNELTLLDHRLSLTPRGDGSHDAELVLEFTAAGTLLAELGVGGASPRFEDELSVPRQQRTLAARLRLTASPEGYLITPLELPADFEVTIESRLGSRLVAACIPLAALGLAPVSCDGLARAFSRVRLPLPAAGGTYLFEAERLRPESRELLDGYLRRTAPPPEAQLPPPGARPAGR